MLNDNLQKLDELVSGNNIKNTVNKLILIQSLAKKRKITEEFCRLFYLIY